MKSPTKWNTKGGGGRGWGSLIRQRKNLTNYSHQLSKMTTKKKQKKKNREKKKTVLLAEKD